MVRQRMVIKYFGRHFLTCLQNAWTVLMKLITVIYSRPHDANEIFKVIGSKVKITGNIFRKCTSLAEAPRSTVHCQRLSIWWFT